jgi:hypothetical protein
VIDERTVTQAIVMASTNTIELTEEEGWTISALSEIGE